MIVRRAARLRAPLLRRAQPVCSGHCLIADAAIPPPSGLSFLTCFFLATGRPLTWGGQGRIDPGRGSADERDAEVKPGCVRAETIPS